MRQTRSFTPLRGVEVRTSGDPLASYTINGHAAVFNEWSLPLGYSGFKERISPGAFARVLSEDPHVTSNWLHDDRWQLGSTEANTLKLNEDSGGLRFWTQVPKTTYADDLRVLLERGDIAQCSFCFTIARETWVKEDLEDESVQLYSTIEEVEDLYDVCVCPMGAYPQTDLAFANNLVSGADRLDAALKDGRVPGLTLDSARARGLLQPGTTVPGATKTRERFLAGAEAATRAARAQLPA
jgi:HK97 family phage prohead protease